MASKTELKEDIAEMSRLTGTEIFSLLDIRSDLEPGKNYNEKVLEEKAEKVFGPLWMDILVQQGLLVPEADGSFSAKIHDAAATGGGVCYSGDNGSMINVGSIKNTQVMYHEFGHSFQHSLNLFDSEKMEKIYDFCKKGIKAKSESDLEKKMVGTYLYNRHLTEAHSEAFSFACMDLSAKTPISRTWNKLQSWATDKTMFTQGLFDIRTGEDKYLLKSYSSSPSRRELNKRFKNYRKTGEIKNFYKEDGQIDFIKLAKEVEDIVIKSTYSPREYKNFVTQKFYKKNDKNGRDWQLDTLKAVASFPLVVTLSIADSATGSIDIIKSNINVLKSKTKALFKNKLPIKPLLEEKDNESKAINSFFKIHSAKAKLFKAFPNKKKNYASFFIDKLDALGYVADNMPIPDCVSKKLLNDWSQELGMFGKKRITSAVNNYVKEVNLQMKNNQKNKDFAIVMTNYGGSYSETNILAKVRDIKAQADIKAIPEYLTVKQPIKNNREQKYLINDIDHKTKPSNFSKICDSEEKAMALKNELLQKMVENPDALSDKKFLKEMTSKYSKNNKGIDKEIEKQAMSFQVFALEERHNPHYEEMKEQIRGDKSTSYIDNFSEMSRKNQEQIKAEREAKAQQAVILEQAPINNSSNEAQDNKIEHNTIEEKVETKTENKPLEVENKEISQPKEEKALDEMIASSGYSVEEITPNIEKETTKQTSEEQKPKEEKALDEMIASSGYSVEELDIALDIGIEDEKNRLNNTKGNDKTKTSVASEKQTTTTSEKQTTTNYNTLANKKTKDR